MTSTSASTNSLAMGLTNWVFLQQSRGTFVGGADAEKLDLIEKLGEIAKRVS